MTRRAHLDAVRALEDTATALVFDALSAVLGRVAGGLAAVTAAADEVSAEPLLSVDDVARLPGLWSLEVDGSLLPWYREVFDAGADAAAEQVTEMRRPADLLPEVADDVEDMPDVLDDADLADVGLDEPEPLPDLEPGDTPTTRRLAEVLDDDDLDDVGLGRRPFLIDTGGDPAFMNESATRHLAQARDRFLRVGDEVWADARQALLESMARGDGTDAAARRLRDVVDVGRARAAAVARTEVISAANAGSTARVRSMDADVRPRYKQWLATMDGRTRATHRHADGQTVPLTDRFSVGTAMLDYPGDPNGPDDEVIQCRCSVLYVDDPAGEDLGAILGRQQGGTPPADGVAVAVVERDVFGRVQVAPQPATAVLAGLAAAQMVPGPAQVDATTGEPHTGAMIALVPTDADAGRLTGLGEPPEALHLTLLYLGDSTAIPGDVAAGILAQAEAATSQMLVLTAEAFGAAVWNPHGETSVVLSIGGDGLVEAAAVAHQIATVAALDAHAAAIEALVASASPDALCGWETCTHPLRAHDLSDDGTGAMWACTVDGCGCTDFAQPGSVTTIPAAEMPQLWEPPAQHVPWVAHVCLSYADDPGALLDEALARVGPITFDRLRVAIGGEAYDFPLVDPGVEVSGAGIQTDVQTGGSPMPWEIREGGADCPFEVVKEGTSERVGCHDTREGAEAQLAALYANEPDADGADDLEPLPGEHFHAIAHVEGVSTGRRTFLNAGWRSPPFAFHWQRSSSAHGGVPEVLQAGLVGRVVRDGPVLHMFGPLDLGSPIGAEYARQLVTGFARWVSIGLDEQPVKVTYVWPDGAESNDPLEQLMAEPEQIIYDGGTIGELTGTSIPAQADATIEPTPELVALMSTTAEPVAGITPKVLPVSRRSPLAAVAANVAGRRAPTIADRVQALTAAAYRMEIPDLPPPEWFDEPADLPLEGALNVDENGRIWGLLAPLGVNHRAYAKAGMRREVPFGNVDYDRFNGAGALTTAGRVPAGALTMDCGHADPLWRPDSEVAPAHYDNACSVIGAVRAGESTRPGLRGVWIAGALMPGVRADQVARMLACRCSGDWQDHGDRPGWSELIACLLVPSPGFATGGMQATYDERGALVASSVPVRMSDPPAGRGPLGLVIDSLAAAAGASPAARIADIAATLRED